MEECGRERADSIVKIRKIGPTESVQSTPLPRMPHPNKFKQGGKLFLAKSTHMENFSGLGVRFSVRFTMYLIGVGHSRQGGAEGMPLLIFLDASYRARCLSISVLSIHLAFASAIFPNSEIAAPMPLANQRDI